MTKHTPGPWKAASESESFGPDPESVTIFSLSDAEYAPARAYGDSPEQMRANASLIAAAPEMLGLIARIAQIDGAVDIDDPNTGHNVSFRDWARALARQIEGQS